MNHDPAWLNRLRDAATTATSDGLRHTRVRVDDLTAAVTACSESAPTAPMQVAATIDGRVAMDFQKPIRVAYCTAEQAEVLATSLLKQAHIARAQRGPVTTS